MPVPARDMTDEPATSSDEPQGAVVAPVTTEAQSVKVSRAGRNLPAERIRTLEAAKPELRKLFKKAA